MSSLSSLVEFRNGELYLFDSLVKRHTEMPWLFSATDMHKACKSPIHSSAKKKGKAPEVYFESKKPAQWLKRNLLNDEERIAKVASRLREKIKEYGPGMGLVELDRKSKLTAVSLLSNLSDLESIVYTKRGGAKGEAGTYVSLHVLLAYSSFLSVNLKDAILEVITSVISGEVETVTEQTTKAKAIAKGTLEREEDKAWSSEFKHAVAGKHASVPWAEEGLNRGTLGMSAKEFQENTGCSAPIQNYFTPKQLRVRKTAVVDIVCDLAEDPRSKISTQEMRRKCFVAGRRARAIWEDPSIREALDKVIAADVAAFDATRKVRNAATKAHIK